jgi:hypothetical protein
MFCLFFFSFQPLNCLPLSECEESISSMLMEQHSHSTNILLVSDDE